MNSEQEQQFDSQLMYYIGNKLIKIGNFMLAVSRLGGFVTAIWCMFNYRCYKRLLVFRVFTTATPTDYWNESMGTTGLRLKPFEYYSIDYVKPRIVKLLEFAYHDTILAGITFVTGAVGAASVMLGNYLRKNSTTKYNWRKI
jgi:hypothetical protein